jgi:hypothetical protein
MWLFYVCGNEGRCKMESYCLPCGAFPSALCVRSGRGLCCVLLLVLPRLDCLAGIHSNT